MYKEQYAKLVAGVRRAGVKQFLGARFSIAGDGRAVAIRGEKLPRVELSALPLHYMVFVDCDLRQASLAGAFVNPVCFIRCDLRGVDLRGCTGVIEAYQCDFRHAKWNGETRLGKLRRDAVPSCLARCRLDGPLATFLDSQAVSFPDQLSQQQLGAYAEAGDILS